MRPGWKTSEFWLAAAWLLLTSFGVLALAFTSWPTALCLAPSVSLLVYMAAALCNNYGENRFLLKAGPQPEEEDGRRQSMGFRSLAVQQAEAEEEEEDEE